METKLLSSKAKREQKQKKKEKCKWHKTFWTVKYKMGFSYIINNKDTSTMKQFPNIF